MTEPGQEPATELDVELDADARRGGPPLPERPRLRYAVADFLFERTSGWGLPSIFFLLTVASTLFMGGVQGISFWAPELFGDGAPLPTQIGRFILYGSPFSFTILAIIFCHEMGHYVAARRYQVDTTLPFFIPFPISLIGTLGAFIFIKSRFPHRKALADIGLAGPFAGFVVVLVALVAGVWTSRPSPPLPPESSISFGEPLLFQLVASLVWPEMPEGYILYVSPIGLAAWFGLLLTAINLLPVGQLDGGHASYAIFRGGAHRISKLVFLAMFPMAYFGPSWLIWAALLYFLGINRPHPPTIWDGLPLPRSRKVLGALGLVVFLLCVTPEPIKISWSDVWSGFQGMF